MSNKNTIERQNQKKIYQKPVITNEKNMTFMFDGIKKTMPKMTCRQCSSCHGCR
jgi:hypothetical protein